MAWVVVVLLLLSCGTAAASKQSPDFVFINLTRFGHVRDVRIETNAVLTSLSYTPVLLRQNKWAASWNHSEWENMRTLKSQMFLVRILLVPLVLLFVLVQTRSFLQASPHSGWVLFSLVGLIWFMGLRVLVDEYRQGPLLLGAALLVGIVIVVCRNQLRVGSPLAGCAIMLLAISCLAPFERWLVPKSYAYLDDYEFPLYPTSSTSTNWVAVHEKLSLRNLDRKAVMYADGRIERLRRVELEQLLKQQLNRAPSN